jgi:hypothetical protein
MQNGRVGVVWCGHNLDVESSTSVLTQKDNDQYFAVVGIAISTMPKLFPRKPHWLCSQVPSNADVDGRTEPPAISITGLKSSQGESVATAASTYDAVDGTGLSAKTCKFGHDAYIICPARVSKKRSPD